jgi:hypothetical protein
MADKPSTADKPSSRDKPELLVAGLTVTTGKTHTGATANLTGGPATAAVTFQFTMPGGGVTSVPATTDGTGAASQSVVPSSPGTLSVQVVQAQATVVVAGPTTAKVSG